ncbi:hypothetical protein DSO57_1018402 [Entomophthora muscae]|uniref:Uncharacterized protein n=1 Tax=Entomophthora muscae TaxID=34485 RepID=A0ACC2U2Q0_9FUNG|nr:hypothetical protein DSO57_1018402 [Entomophthora muscae]
MPKTTFLKKFAMKDSNMVIMTEVRTFKMTGTIEEYIAAYKDLNDQAPRTINFEKAGLQLDFYNGLPTHIRLQFDMTLCKNLQDVFLEEKHAAQESDNLQVTNKQKESLTAIARNDNLDAPKSQNTEPESNPGQNPLQTSRPIVFASLPGPKPLAVPQDSASKPPVQDTRNFTEVPTLTLAVCLVK